MADYYKNPNKQTRYVAFIIHLRGFEDYEILQICNDVKLALVNNCDFFAFCVHNQDVDSNGKLETIHIQGVAKFDLSFQKTRLKWYIQFFSDLCHVHDSAVTINWAKDFIGNVKYVIHARDEDVDKHHYAIDDVYTSDKETFIDYLNSDTNNLTGEKLYQICLDCKFNSFRIMCALGPQRYTYYKRAIECCLEEYKNRS